MTNLNNISERATLATLKLSKWAGSCVDKKVSSEIIEQHSAAEESGRFSKRLIPKEALRALSSVHSEARAFHKDSTLAWDDGTSIRLLPAKSLMAYTDKMRILKDKHVDALGDFMSEYQKYKTDSSYSLGSMFSDDDYPNEDELFQKFDFDFRFDPVPQADDFRCEIDSGVKEMIQNEMKERLNNKYSDAMKNLWKRIETVVAHMNEKLSDPDAMFKKSMLENVEELVSALPDLNFMEEQAIVNMTSRLKNELCKFTVEDLRKDPEARKEAAERSGSILKEMAGFYA